MIWVKYGVRNLAIREKHSGRVFSIKNVHVQPNLSLNLKIPAYGMPVDTPILINFESFLSDR